MGHWPSQPISAHITRRKELTKENILMVSDEQKWSMGLDVTRSISNTGECFRHLLPTLKHKALKKVVAIAIIHVQVKR